MAPPCPRPPTALISRPTDRLPSVAEECCPSLEISTVGPSNATQAVRMGVYHRHHFNASFSSRPIYVHSARKEFLFYVDNMDTDKLTISLVSDTKKERRVTKGAKAFGKALVFLLTRSYHLKCNVLCARFLK